eukprot:COSAG06_NODE_24500_length_660_cov_24.130125_2_plen_93_part_01
MIGDPNGLVDRYRGSEVASTRGVFEAGLYHPQQGKVARLARRCVLCGTKRPPFSLVDKTFLFYLCPEHVLANDRFRSQQNQKRRRDLGTISPS